MRDNKHPAQAQAGVLQTVWGRGWSDGDVTEELAGVTYVAALPSASGFSGAMFQPGCLSPCVFRVCSKVVPGGPRGGRNPLIKSKLVQLKMSVKSSYIYFVS